MVGGALSTEGRAADLRCDEIVAARNEVGLAIDEALLLLLQPQLRHDLSSEYALG